VSLTVVFRETALRNLARIRSEDKDLFTRTRRAIALLADQPYPEGARFTWWYVRSTSSDLGFLPSRGGGECLSRWVAGSIEPQQLALRRATLTLLGTIKPERVLCKVLTSTNVRLMPIYPSLR
jgi:hypothetical protein